MNDDQPMSDTDQEYQSNNGKPEALSSVHEDILQNNTKLKPSDIENEKSLLKEVEKSSVILSPNSHARLAGSVDGLDLENTLSDSQHMEVEYVFQVTHGCEANTQNLSAISGIENGHSVESALESDTTQTVVELPMLNQNGDTTQLEDTKIPNNRKNMFENSDHQQDKKSEAESKIQVLPNVTLEANVKSVSTPDVNFSKLENIDNESKSSAPLEMKTEADISTHDIQNRLVDKVGQSEDGAEDNGSTPTEDQKRLDAGENENGCPLKSSKAEELSEGEGFFGLKRKVMGVHSRIPSEELDNVSRNKQFSTAKQTSRDEPQELLSENGAQSHSRLSTVIMHSEDERDSEQPENDTTVQNVCKLLSQENNPKSTEENNCAIPRKTSEQIKDESQQAEVSSNDPCSPGVKKLVGEVYNNKETSGDSAVDGLKDYSRPCQSTLDAEYSTFEISDNISLVPGVHTKTPITPTSYLSLGRVRTEMGPPLPPVVMPLTATPPRFGKHHTPLKPPSGSSELPTDGPKSPKMLLSVPVIDSALPVTSEMSPCLTTPSPSCGVPSSPLQFGSATPKHAVPVPGRLPSSALSSSPPAASQENSMQMLDTMYPDLSARARTLNILRGNVNLNRAGNENGTSPPSVNQISGNKTISSSSTAFTKTEQKPKKTGVNMILPKSAKRLRLDNCSPAPPGVAFPAEQVKDPQTVIKTKSLQSHQEVQSNQQKVEKKPDNTIDNNCQISEALAKVGKSCFDILPVVKSHVFLGRISQVPILTDEEKAVIADFCVNQVCVYALHSSDGLSKQCSFEDILMHTFSIFFLVL